MEFFERLGETVTTTGQAAVEKAREIQAIARLKGQIAACEEVIRKNYLVF